MFAIYRVCFFFLTCFPFSSTCKNLSCGFYMHGMVIGNGKSLLSLLSRVQIRTVFAYQDSLYHYSMTYGQKSQGTGMGVRYPPPGVFSIAYIIYSPC